MSKVPTAEEFTNKLDKILYPVNPSETSAAIDISDVREAMKKFAKLHVEAIKNLQQSKYYAGETGYITKGEWEEIIKNIK
jgi:hypothetical protein